MTGILLIALTAICLGLLIWGMQEKGRIYEFPFLAGATFTGFVLPQLIGLRNNQDLPEGALGQTVLMAILCASMCYLGYQWPCRPVQQFNWSFDKNKLVGASAVLTLIGAFFFYKISRLPEDITEASLWTGLPVAFLFFASILSYGFALAALIYADKKAKWALGIAMVGSVFYLDRIVLSGRRGVTLEFVFIILLTFWFARGRAVPRPLMLIWLLLGTLALHSTGEYRALAKSGDESVWKQIQAIPLVENLQQQLQEGGIEMENAVFEIAATEQTAGFDYGIFHWNELVFNYVPAQLFGDEFKQSLLIPLENADSYTTFGHVAPTGSTTTGLVDCFRSFGYFGCLKFFFIALILRKLYAAAMQGHLVARVSYMLIITNALHAITHHTQWFISPWVHMGIFLLPALYFAGERAKVASVLPSLVERRVNGLTAV